MTHKNQFQNFLKKNKILILILAVVILLRLPSLFEPNHYADEDIYLTLGMGVRKGLTLYRDIHDNKPPLIYLTAALAGNITNFKIILFFWNLTNVILAWFLAKKFFKSKWAIALTTLIFGIFSTLPFLEGNIANGEIFMIMPVTAAVLLLFSKKPNYFWSGILLSVGFLFKVPVLFEFLGILFWLTFFQQKTLKLGFKKLFSKDILLFILGFIFPIILTVIYYFFVGASSEYIKAAFFQNVGYLSSWENHPAFYQTALFYKAILVAIIFLLIYFYRKKITLQFGFIIIWFIAALFGSLLSNRPYPHYLIEIVLPAALLLSIAIFKNKFSFKFIATILLSLLVFSFYYFDFWHYQSLNYYQNFIQYKLGLIDQTQYLEFFGTNVTDDQEIADYIKQFTQEDDKIFIWGTEPAIYVLSDRLPVGRYTVAYHISDFDGFDETMTKIKTYLPKFIIYYQNNNSSFEELDNFINNYYFATKVVNDIIIYKLR